MSEVPLQVGGGARGVGAAARPVCLDARLPPDAVLLSSKSYKTVLLSTYKTVLLSDCPSKLSF